MSNNHGLSGIRFLCGDKGTWSSLNADGFNAAVMAKEKMNCRPGEAFCPSSILPLLLITPCSFKVVMGLRTRVDWKVSSQHDALGINDFAVQCRKSDAPGE